MSKKNRLWIAAMGTMLLASCYKYDGTESYMIKNNTDRLVTLTLDSGTTYTMTRSIDPHSMYQLDDKTGPGAGEPKDGSALTATPIREIKQDTLLCKKDFHYFSAWQVTKTTKYIRHYTLNLEPSDF